MKRYQANDRFLRRVLFANGLFSALSGLALLIAAAPTAGLLFNTDAASQTITPSTVLAMIGAGLIVFAAFVIHTAKQALINRTHVKLISFADALWVAESAAVLLLYPSHFSTFGYEVVVIVAIVVGLLATGQMLGLAALYQGISEISIAARGDTMTITASHYTTASPERVWQVMSHQESYADVADNISKVEVIEGTGQGMIRQCRDTKGKAWRETCTSWDDGRAFAFRVHTEAADYPYPIAQLVGEWSLAPAPDQTQIKMVFGVHAKPGIVNRLLFKLMSAPFANICNRLLQRWAAIMEGQATSSAGTPVHESQVSHSS